MHQDDVKKDTKEQGKSGGAGRFVLCRGHYDLKKSKRSENERYFYGRKGGGGRIGADRGS